MPEKGPEFSHSFETGEIVEIARAITERDMNELAMNQRLALGAAGQAETPMPPEMRREIALARTALLMQLIENPSAKIDLKTAIESISSDTSRVMAAIINENEVDEVSVEEARTVLEGLGKGFLEMSGIQNEQAAEQFAKTFAAAEQVATQRNLNIAEVYRDDELYLEAFRKAFPFEEYVAEQIQGLDKISEETMNTFLVRMVESMIPPAMREENA